MQKSVLLLLMVLFGSVRAQETLGLINDNYLPTNGVQLNPSVIVDQKPWLDIHWVGLGAFGTNNYAYIPNTYLIDPSMQYQDPKWGLQNFVNPNIEGYANAEVNGPGFTVAFKESALGFHSRVRGLGKVAFFPSVLGHLIREKPTGDVLNGLYKTEDARVKMGVWGEVGIDYGHVLLRRNKEFWSAGITINKTFGLFNSSMIIDRAMVSVNNNKGKLESLEGQYAYVKPALGAGGGWSGSIGINYRKMKKDVSKYMSHSVMSDCQSAEYYYRVSASIIDIGYVTYDKDAVAGTFNSSSSPSQVKSISEGAIQREMNLHSSDRDFTSGMPTSFVAAIDVNLGYGFFFNSTVLQSLVVPSWNSLERGNMASAAIRFESPYFGVGIPVMLQGYTQPQVGLAFRMGPLSIGTDHLIPFFQKKDHYSADLYFQLNIKLFQHPDCMPEKSIIKKILCLAPKSGRKKKQSCADW